MMDVSKFFEKFGYDRIQRECKLMKCKSITRNEMQNRIHGIKSFSFSKHNREISTCEKQEQSGL